MRNTVLKSISHKILIISKRIRILCTEDFRLSKNNENMRNENEKSFAGSTE